MYNVAKDGLRVTSDASSSPLSAGKTRVLNLVFHGITEDTSPRVGDWWLQTSAFERALDSLVGRPDVRITFDDGFASDAAIALPALQARGLTATFFITTNWIDNPGHVSAHDIQRMVSSGMTIGSHGRTHVRWTELAHEQLEHELAASRSILEEITNAPVTAAACPRGAYGRAVIGAVRRAGYETLFTTDLGLAAPDAVLQPRTLVYPEMIGPAGLRLPGPPSFGVRARRALKRWR